MAFVNNDFLITSGMVDQWFLKMLPDPQGVLWSPFCENGASGYIIIVCLAIRWMKGTPYTNIILVINQRNTNIIMMHFLIIRSP